MKPQEHEFVARRRIYTRRWNVVAIVSVIIILAMALNLYITMPYMIDFLHVRTMIEARELSSGTIIMMAMMLPYAVAFIFFLLLVLIVYATVMIANEKRYLEILKENDKTPA